MEWKVGQTVQVQSRTWAGINKPGGCAKITKVHRTVDGDYIEGLDVKYLVGGGSEKHVDPAIVSPFETLERGGRKRRGREFLHEQEDAKTENEAGENDGDEEKQPQAGAADLSSSRSNHAAVPAQSGSSSHATTAYSTPQKQRSKTKNTHPPKKVTPVPKLVQVGKKSDTVSPMTEERDVSNKNNKQLTEERSTVARGLCFDSVAGVSNNKETVNSSKKTNNDVKSTKAQATDSTPQRRPGVENARNAEHNEGDQKPAARPSSVANSAPLSSGKKKIIGVQLTTTTGLVASRSGASSKRPMKQSFSRTTSAYTVPPATAAAAASRKPLLDVYRDEVKRARAFMDEMVAPREDDVHLDSPADESKASSRGGQHRFIRTNSRYDEFLSSLPKVWMRIDDEEVNEDRFKAIFQQQTGNSFAPSELDDHIQSLCNEGKLMKSDGVLYKID